MIVGIGLWASYDTEIDRIMATYVRPRGTLSAFVVKPSWVEWYIGRVYATFRDPTLTSRRGGSAS
jgi:hypothetical protein